jgi:CHAT domain-containing protein
MLLGSANACLQQGLPYSALAFQAATLENARQWNQSVPIAEAYLHRAENQQKLGMSAEAMADLSEAEVWAEKLGSDPFAARVRARIQLAAGEIQQQAQPAAAVASLSTSLEFFQKAGLKAFVARAYLARGRAQIAGGDLARASSDFQEGIHAFEQQRASTKAQDIRVASFDRPWDLFTEMIRLKALNQSQPEAALRFAEQSRSRTLLEAVSRSDLTVPSDPSQIRQQLPDGIAIAFYSVLDDRVLGWVVRKDGITFFQRSVRESELARLVRDTRLVGSTRSRESSKRLYDELIRPLQATLESHTRLVIVPDGVLHTLPFAALIDRNTERYLIQDRPVEITPSIAVFLESAQTATPPLEAALVVGNPRFSEPELRLPDLPEAETEAREIAALYRRASLLTGATATKDDFLSRIGRNHVVHFAGHAISNVSFPGLSRLLFAGSTEGSSGSLFAHEIGNRDLSSVRIVVLAGCRTSSGQIRRGEGVISLARPFLAAGVPTVLATLWDLNDRASRPLFVEFHRGVRHGLAPVDALRQAQLRLIESGNPDLTSPTSWAAVTAIGGIAGWRGANGAGLGQSQ